VTGASSGIGLELARMLGREGYAVTITARREEKLLEAAHALRAEGIDVHAVAASVEREAEVQRIVEAHRARWARLDVLVNSAGVGLEAPIEGYPTKTLDLQLAVNLRATMLFCRECLPLLRAAALEHRGALVVNVASLTGKRAVANLGVYSATKAGIVAFTEAMNLEHAADGIRSCALCPGYVDTPMSDYLKEVVAATDMIRPSDIAEMVRALLRLSPAAIVPEIQFVRPGGGL
jgi:NAD(P)-dependent dehydrogenase (short-subunit alcohol dehydrogenase family)